MDKYKTKSDVDLLRPLLMKPEWELMEKYVAGEKERLVTQLCNCNEDSLKDLQGQIKALKRLESLRDKLKTEKGSIR